MSDLFHQDHATVREWTDVLVRIRFGTVKVAGKNVSGARIKGVAGRLANYGDSDGSRVRPGIARIAVDLETDYATVKRAVQHLTRIGLLKRIRAGSKAGHADLYQLAIPVDLLDRDDLEVWSPARHALEVQRVADANRGRYTRREPSPDPGDVQVPQAPADKTNASGVQVSEAPAQAPVEPEPAGACGTDISRPAGASGTDLRWPQGPATYQDLVTTTTDHADDDLDPAVTGPRATVLEPRTDLSDVVLPDRCEHGLPSRRRPDGSPSCALCRRGAPTDAAIAPVIPIRSAS